MSTTSNIMFTNSQHERNPVIALNANDPQPIAELSSNQKAVAIALTAIAALSVALAGACITASLFTASLYIAASLVATCIATAAIGALTFFGVRTALKNNHLSNTASNIPAPNNDTQLPAPTTSTAIDHPSAPISAALNPPVINRASMPPLPNVGASCWVNTLLKFIASTQHYNQMLNLDLNFLPEIHQGKPKRDYIEVQAELRNSASKLRQNRALTAAECRRLREALEKLLRPSNSTHNPNERYSRRDACEVFVTLSTAFELSQDNVRRVFTQHQSLQPISIEQLLIDQGQMQDAGDVVTIYLENKTLQAEIILDIGHTIHLLIENSTTGDLEHHTYQLEAAMHNTGGHWVFYENNHGQIIRHNDARLLTDPEQAQNVKKSNAFRFRRIAINSA